MMLVYALLMLAILLLRVQVARPCVAISKLQ